MGHVNTSIDRLIKIIQQGGSVRTGIDIYNSKKTKTIEKTTIIKDENILLKLRAEGIQTLPISRKLGGGTWDKQGTELKLTRGEQIDLVAKDVLSKLPEIDKKIEQIEQIKKEASVKFENAKKNIKKVISDIKDTGGEFDYGQVENTVTELLDFINTDESAFSLLTREIFSYDDYLYNHSINVCTIGTPVIKHFINKYGKQFGMDYPEKIKEISIGYFMHDAGKVLVPEEILNKKGPLTDEEFEVVKTHSYKLGMQVFEKNHLNDPLIVDSVKWHHGPMFKDEGRCYPNDVAPEEIPAYVKVCKLADIYDALTSVRCYKNAFNPIEVVTDLFTKYATKGKLVQKVLLSFISVVGIYPPGSVVFLSNGQMAYIIDSKGPILLVFSDDRGGALKHRPDPIDLSDPNRVAAGLKIDHKRPMTTPVKVYNKLPKGLREMIFSK
ncbi:HD domain-containing phosphohydrolase [uncultured Desulfobacter sp.]|uniref:HD-GYP domain-containing protein n=1 Tax=uncultured Desulfobacter sp. TaxID=240139 RepID=UPI0029F4EAF8|nr:HD domain-containing phosphohydrolase [uncultured Desulfobacter sp.]